MTSLDSKRRFIGAQNKAAGQYFENMIERSLKWHGDRGLMRVVKTPEPMKPIRQLNQQGQFLACYTKKAQVDFSGTLAGGRAIRFEAKQTDTDRFTRERLSEDQMKDLEANEQLGALCFVLICFGFDHVYRIPWHIWRDMKEVFGRKYVTEADVSKYRLPFEDGAIQILTEPKTEEGETIL